MNKNKLELFTFVKDEVDFISSFVEYHKHIFDKITIIDSGSTDGTLEILQTLNKKQEIQLIEGHFNFSDKGEICTELMKNSSCELLIPLDADEKIIFDDGLIRSNNINLIREYLQNIKITGNKYKIYNTYDFHPDDDGWYGIRRHTKMIFPQKTFMYTDGGFHRGRTTLDPDSHFDTPHYWRAAFNSDIIIEDKITNINLSYIHYHYKSKNIWLKNTEKKLRARLGHFWNNLETLQSYTGPSIHSKVKYLEYLKTGEWNFCQKNIFLGNI